MALQHQGPLPNAPLVYVLAQVVFDDYSRIDQVQAEIQERLLAKYPGKRPVQMQGFRIGPEGLLPGERTTHWQFSDASNRHGFILQAGSLVVHTTDYTTYSAFETRLLEVLNALRDALPSPIMVRRQGLRYIDVIVPRDGSEWPEDYVSERLRHDPYPGIPYEQCMGISISEYVLQQGKLVVRYARQYGQVSLPPDLGDLTLELPGWAAKPVPGGQPIGILDTDRIIEGSLLLDPQELLAKFEIMHKDVKNAFEALTTSHAHSVWTTIIT